MTFARRALLAALLVVSLALRGAAATAAREDVPPLLPGNELPLPLDALIADGPAGPVPFPLAGPPGPPGPPGPFGPEQAWREVLPLQVQLMMGQPQPRHRCWRGAMGHLGASPSPFLTGPHPPGPHPPPGPPPPGAMELALKLMAAVGEALESFYANQSSTAATPLAQDSAAPAAAHTCGYCVGNETLKLVEATEASISSLCDAAPAAAADAEDSPARLAAAEALQHFCELFPRLKAVTVLGILSRLETNPLSLALTRCAAQGPCSFAPAQAQPEASSDGASLRAILQEVEAHVEVAQESFSRVEEAAETEPSVALGMGLAEDPDVDAGSDCQDCIVSAMELVREVVEAKFHFVCSNAHCPRIRAMCAFTKEHPYLTMVGVILKIKPWKAIPACFILGACKPPPPPPGPPGPPPPLDGVHPLPIFPNLDVNIFAPPLPPPPPPPASIMGLIRRVISFIFLLRQPGDVA